MSDATLTQKRNPAGSRAAPYAEIKIYPTKENKVRSSERSASPAAAKKMTTIKQERGQLDQNLFKPKNAPRATPGGVYHAKKYLPFFPCGAFFSFFALLDYNKKTKEKQMMEQNRNNKTGRQSGHSSYHKGGGGSGGGEPLLCLRKK